MRRLIVGAIIGGLLGIAVGLAAGTFVYPFVFLADLVAADSWLWCVL